MIRCASVFPDGSYAEETLYRIIRYPGWTLAAERHGPPSFINDPVVVRLTSAVSNALSASSSIQQLGPFNFFQSEKKDLSRLLTIKFDGPYGVEFATISSYEFKQLLAKPPLPDSACVKDTLEALRGAKDAQALPGRDRLIKVQNHLVEPLVDIEKKEGYMLFHGERKKCGALTRSPATAGNIPLRARSP